MNFHVLYVLELNTSKKKFICVYICMYVCPCVPSGDTISFEEVSGSKKNLVVVFYA